MCWGYHAPHAACPPLASSTSQPQPTPCVHPAPGVRRIKAQRLAHEGKPATEIVELGAGPTPDDAYKVSAGAVRGWRCQR